MGKGGQNIKAQQQQRAVRRPEGGKEPAMRKEPTKDEFYLVTEQQWHMQRYVEAFYLGHQDVFDVCHIYLPESDLLCVDRSFGYGV